MDKSKLFHPPEGEDKKHAYHSPLEEKIVNVLTPFQEYISNQVTASVLLLISTLLALVFASVPAVSHWYYKFISAPIGLYFSSHVFERSLKFLVNDVLLTLFFFFVGLEIKYEFLVGGLSNRRRAAFVLFAAFGGMLLPALIYFLFNVGTPAQIGWGIPMATDTAFALGILVCFRKKLPKGLFIFLAAIAIVDDIGAIIVVAVFYTPHLDVLMLLFAFICVGVLIVINYAGFRKPYPYLLVGLVMWTFIEAAGIHGTMAGILIAFLIPARPKKGPRQFLKRTKVLLNVFEKQTEKEKRVLEDKKQHAVLEEVQEVAQEATTPLQRWESKLELPVALIVLPLFAFVNIGIPIKWHLLANVFTHPVTLGIFLGLIFGKPLGVLLFSYVALRFRFGLLPENTGFKHLASASMLTGIGFTMSLFIANLSFTSTPDTLIMSKAAILLGSLVAGLAGIACLSFMKSDV